MDRTEILEHNLKIREYCRTIGANHSAFTYDKPLADAHDIIYQLLLEFNEGGDFKFLPRMTNRRAALGNRYWLRGSTQYCNVPTPKHFLVSFWEGNVEKMPPFFLGFDLDHGNEVSMFIRTYTQNPRIWCMPSIEFLKNKFVPLFIEGGQFNHLIKSYTQETNGILFKLGKGDMESITEKFIYETWPIMNDLVIQFDKENTLNKTKQTRYSVAIIDNNDFNRHIINIDKYY